MTITLRPHQQNALEAMQKYNKGQVIIPTGGGKTICMIKDAKRQIDANIMHRATSFRDQHRFTLAVKYGL